MTTAKARFEPSKLRVNIPPLGPDYRAMYEAAEEQLNRIRTILDRSPECDTYPPDATLGCGWKRDLLDIKHIMEDQ